MHDNPYPLIASFDVFNLVVGGVVSATVPDLDVIKVYRLVEGRYLRAMELTLAAHDLLRTPLMPGLELALADVFEE